MEPSFNPYARGPPAGANFVPFAPQQSVAPRRASSSPARAVLTCRSPQAFGIPQASAQAPAAAVDPFTLEGLRAPATGFPQAAFQPSFAPSFAPSNANAAPYSTGQPAHFAAFAPPAQAQPSFAPAQQSVRSRSIDQVVR